MAGFAQGLITVQDVSSMLVARSAGIEPGMHILDVCAAPGGKSCHAADILGGTGLVLARDVSPAKTALIEENRDRQRLGNLQVQVWDATTEDESREEWADILFCDVPCSGLGVMGRKRDIKYRITEDSLKELVLLQQSILSASWKQVKKGGILMYSTCTINREENEEQVKWFVEHFPFEIVSFADQLPEQLRQEEQKWGLQLLCGIHETDGFFLCKLRRKS
jgi:16S rRNA (cytosine967-C5)-methyltransferase